MKLEARQITKAFGQKPVINGISLKVENGEFAVLIGPNACGKTVFLRILAGLTPPTSGDIKLVEDAGGKATMAFQRSPLFPWMTVRENLLISLNDERARSEKRKEVESWLSEARLSPWADFYPSQISGGVRQKVNIVRSLMNNPPLVLMDEPFASLDYLERRTLQNFVSDLQFAKKTTILFVTHDIPEAIFLSNRILVMSREGRIATELPSPFPKPRQHEMLQRDTIYMDMYDKLSAIISGS